MPSSSRTRLALLAVAAVAAPVSLVALGSLNTFSNGTVADAAAVNANFAAIAAELNAPVVSTVTLNAGSVWCLSAGPFVVNETFTWCNRTDYTFGADNPSALQDASWIVRNDAATGTGVSITINGPADVYCGVDDRSAVTLPSDGGWTKVWGNGVLATNAHPNVVDWYRRRYRSDVTYPHTHTWPNRGSGWYAGCVVVKPSWSRN